MTQWAIPDGDSGLHTGWSQGAGDGNLNAWEELDEGFGAGRGSGSGPDDATTYWVNSSALAGSLGSTLTNVTDPVSATGHVYRSREAKSASGGKQLDLTIELREGLTTVRASTTVTNFNTTTWTTHEIALSAAQADSITDYTNLVGQITTAWPGGGAARDCYLSAQEFECGPKSLPPVQPRTQKALLAR